MKMTYLKIKGQTFALAFTLEAMSRLEERLPGFSLDKLTEYVKSASGMIDLIEILAQQGEYLEGRTLDKDRAWFGSHLSPSPSNLSRIQVAVLNALAEGMRMETEDESEGEKDVVLEELKKKETKDA